MTAQVQAVSSAVGNGLPTSSLKDLSLYTLTAVDFDNNPYVFITITTPEPIDDFWQYLNSVGGSEWQGHPENSPWTVTISGARTDVSPISMTGVGLEDVVALRDTVKNMGGSNNLKRIVAATTTSIILQHTNGDYWDLGTLQRIDPRYLQVLKENYDIVKQARADGVVTRPTYNSWTANMPKKILSGPIFDPYGEADFANLDGTLNPSRFRSSLEPKGLSGQVIDKPYWHCYNLNLASRCYSVEQGHIPRNKNAHGTSLYQDPPHFGWYKGKKFVSFDCTTGHPHEGTWVPLGCAPASFISMLWKYWYDGYKLFGKYYNGEPHDNWYRPYQSHYGSIYKDSIAMNMTLPLNPANPKTPPNIVHRMRGCFLINGTMVTAKPFIAGGNAILAEQNKLRPRGQKRLLLTGNHTKIGGHAADARNKGIALRTQIGKYNRPVVAEYWQSKQNLFKAGHFSPVIAYQFYTPTNASAAKIGYQVFVQTIDSEGKWYSLSDNDKLELGVFYIVPH